MSRRLFERACAAPCKGLPGARLYPSPQRTRKPMPYRWPGFFAAALIVVALTSAVLNNIPVVVIFVPIMQSLATRTGRSAGRYMMPLSFAAILGGMTTLIGSSTNLLVSNELVALGEPGFGFFSFTIPGLVVAGVGMIYVLFVAPRLLGSAKPASEAQAARKKQFLAEITIQQDSALCGMTAVSGFFPKLKDLTVLALERDGERLLRSDTPQSFTDRTA